MSAIDANPQAGQDPSHPAFWLPGQELNNQNMRGEWSLYCDKQIGDACQAGYECCNGGFCLPDANGVLTCSENPGQCSPIGSACTTAADCCNPGAECIGGFCAQPQPE